MHTGCSPEDLVGEGELPTDAQDPEVTRTREGAISAYYGALITFRNAVAGREGSFVAASGLLSDELQQLTRFSFGYPSRDIDSRNLPEWTDFNAERSAGGPYIAAYVQLHKVRSQAGQAAVLLERYAPDIAQALSGHLAAAEAYAEVYLADLFCSGIPLSTVEFDGDYTLRPGSPTADVYLHAVGLFDRALTLAEDSTRLMHFARVGRGRALLALGRYADAAAAVAAVPDGFEYLFTFDATPGTGFELLSTSFVDLLGGSLLGLKFFPGMGDREGTNGLDYLSSGDPRTAGLDNGPTSFNPLDPHQYLPRKYATVEDPPLFAGDMPVTIAGWHEARLIEAEAALQGGDVTGFLDKLNGLRRAYDPVALPDLVDPGQPEARVDLLFRERASWLHLTGHRQGDLRRLIRQYGRNPVSVYPVGLHPAGVVYGTHVTAPVPASERLYNRHYTGCIHRGA